MREERFKIKAFAASAYLLFVPSIYIVLSSARQTPFVSGHGKHALFLWIKYLLIFFGMRLLVNTVWRFYFFSPLEYLEIVIVLILAGHCLFSALRALNGQAFSVPR
ncbi:MAG: DUF4870 domain-containing protein [Candidatus Margulisbacteria bacterium]|nr:DUF4870 domain-containing protein [Candidatus Margulisiibacteriota bacterium]